MAFLTHLGSWVGAWDWTPDRIQNLVPCCYMHNICILCSKKLRTSNLQRHLSMKRLFVEAFIWRSWGPSRSNIWLSAINQFTENDQSIESTWFKRSHLWFCKFHQVYLYKYENDCTIGFFDCLWFCWYAYWYIYSRLIDGRLKNMKAPDWELRCKVVGSISECKKNQQFKHIQDDNKLQCGSNKGTLSDHPMF